MTQRKTAVLLLAHGSPDSPADVPEFLKYVTGGRAIPQSAVEEIQHRYRLIGRSPLTEITLAQGSAMQRELGLPVYLAMPNSTPSLPPAVKHVADSLSAAALPFCLP